jgi:hypothetical protein
VVTNYKLGQFKLDYEEYKKLKVMFQFIRDRLVGKSMFQFIDPDFSYININIIYKHYTKPMKAHFALNTRSEPQRCVQVHN